MAGQTLLKQIKREEKKLSSDIEIFLNTALSNKRLLAKVDKVTTACSASKTPPKEITKLFETALAQALVNLKSVHPAAHVRADLIYTQTKGMWRAKAKSKCGLRLQQLGGKNYVVKPGDTLWKIARDHYGSGGLWVEIAAANKNNVSSRGDFILAGVTLKLPKLSVPVEQCGVEMVAAKTSVPKEAIKAAKQVCVPPYTLDLNLTKPTVRIIQGPIVSWKVTTKLTGELMAVCDLLMDSGATLKSTGAVVEKEAMGFVSGVEVNAVGQHEIKLGARLGGVTWGIKLSPGRPGTFTGFSSGKSIKFKSGRTVFSGKIGAEVTIQAMPRVRVQDIKGKLHEFWIDHGKLIEGSALIAASVVVGIAAVGLVATPVPGDEVVAYATAVRMAGAGMRALKFAR